MQVNNQFAEPTDSFKVESKISIRQKDFISGGATENARVLQRFGLVPVDNYSTTALDNKKSTEFIDAITVYIKPFKPATRISSRILEIYDDTVLFECLIDKENSIYEEREFSITLFEKSELVKGNIFLFKFFERIGEARMEVTYDAKGLFQPDFPKFDFVSAFKDIKLFEK